MVSILITMIMILVISLVVLGFAQVARNTQRETLDSELSAQAYYAAESGVNFAAQYFDAHPTAQIDDTSNCTQAVIDLGGHYGTTNVLSATGGTQNVAYTCLNVDSTPPQLNTAPLTQDSNTVWDLKNTDDAAFTSLTFEWDQAPAAANPVGNCNQAAYRNYTAWNCPYGILRVDLVNASTITNAALESTNGSTTTSLFLVPLSSASGLGVSTANLNGKAAQIVDTTCTASDCELKLNLPGGSPEYYARLTMYYADSSSVTLSGTIAAGSANFIGGQAIVDSTGRDQDELRRVQARIPLTESTGAMPNYSLQSTTDVCKQLQDGPGAPELYTDPC